MQSENLFFAIIAALVVLLAVLGYRRGGRGVSLSRRAVTSLAAAIAANLAVVAIYVAAGVAKFDGTCKATLGGEHSCSAGEYLGTIGVIVAAGMVPWLPLFALAWFLAASLGERRSRHGAG